MNTVLDYIWFIGIPLIFIVIVVWVMRPKAKKHWKQDAQIPFAEERDKDKTRNGDDQ